MLPLALAALLTLSPPPAQYRAALGLSHWGEALLADLEQDATAPPARTEAAQRAYMIYVLALVTDWPEGAFQEATSPFVIGLLGGEDLPFDQEGFQHKTVKGHKIVVLKSRNVEALKGAHILYITPGAGQDLTYVLHALGRRSVLTVGEQENFTQLGGIVRCNPAEGLVPSEVNTRVAKEARLAFRSQFLKMVSRVAY